MKQPSRTDTTLDYLLGLCLLRVRSSKLDSLSIKIQYTMRTFTAQYNGKITGIKQLYWPAVDVKRNGNVVKIMQNAMRWDDTMRKLAG